MFRLLFIVCLVGFTLQGMGQGTVRGKVTDNTGESLIGVTVVVKGNTSIGAATDFDGNYSLKLPDSAKYILVVTYVGYKTL